MATLSSSPPPPLTSSSSSSALHRRTATVASPAASHNPGAFQAAIDRVSAAQSSLSSLSTLRSQLTQILPTIRAVVRASGGLDAQRTVVKALREAALDEELRINAEEATPNLMQFLEDWVSWNEAYQTWKSAAHPTLPSNSASIQSLNGSTHAPAPPGAPSPAPAPAPAVSTEVLSGGSRTKSPSPAATPTGQTAASSSTTAGSTKDNKPEGPKVIPLPADVAAQLQRYRRDPDHPDLPPLLGLEECQEIRRLISITKLLRFSSMRHERGGRGLVTEAQAAIWPVRFFFIFDEQEGVVWKCSLTAELIVDEKAKRPRPLSIIDRPEEKVQVPARLFRDHLVQAGRWVQAARLTQDAFLVYVLYCVTGGSEAITSGLIRYLRTGLAPSPPRV